MHQIKKKILIIGAGFGGLQVIKTLANNKLFEITVVDKKNHHLFQPLLYQVATAVLSPADIAIPSRSITTKYKNVKILLGDVTEIDFENRNVKFQNNSETYDYLILATGARTSYFGNHSWKEKTLGLKNLKDALAIRRRILLSFEQAELIGDYEKAKSFMHYVIIGGGPTGVELAGSIAELSHNIIRKDFRNIDSGMTKVTLIEAGPRLLTAFSEKSSAFTKEKLESRGVEVLTSSPVLDITETGVVLKDRTIESKTVIWAAGVEGSELAKKLPLNKDKANRIIVDEYCRTTEYPEVFVIGDAANYAKGLTRPLPGVSPVAMQQGRYVAKIIESLEKKKSITPFHYFDKGNMATIGRTDAVAEFGKIKLKGIFGWLGWLFVHLVYQVGFKNKVSTLLSWVWSYLTFRAGSRLIQEEMDELSVRS
ncbi:NAD(P)/FAD-dependent oxidoreductase [Leptospira sp. 2 VSF19]|uniref:NADH:ubiquinone reductase (non-electrogenic) n=1 Tax=Leptospira soteropolitanensis TaxID=2950025 RepID=A0AAW5VK57_9LEPT|nr:NAD(P)/FAD-dependent oxidoreductase [Leptospira soteropolitanensis]MCW7492724.1 NAD(P)/FAD-dependent oxidoreductase [Leptospira soteropolitanensis]MCW7500407.1 NAD(P)/FAD-dependent oxidoreductase [Leptospira soteropolitanensis]MCW7522558.1 NAD(P)/FAD-dependent oxidoreductase [Leptospira soteropolitanensis]MCW7526414.1 NAD(P)/FAD-dependent oxidoreductase [Leptospira soteropolitanensis]MCW7530377.1 NAD(P)/FAD-dependent oxidoreductase [Leptospira soteropolitanensis]